MEDVKNKVEYVDVSLLKKSNKNPRVIKNRAFAKLCESIKEDPDFLEMRPILCNQNYEIYAGNQRYAACAVLGYKKIPCIITNVDENIQDKRMLRDNLHSGEFDFSILKDKFDKQQVIDVFDDDKIFDDIKEKEKNVITDYCESMELKNFESWDYVVFAFSDSRDFIQVMQKLGIGKVDASFSPKTKKIGIGRVLNGNILVDLLKR